jgi:hypothetical protein
VTWFACIFNAKFGELTLSANLKTYAVQLTSKLKPLLDGTVSHVVLPKEGRAACLLRCHKSVAFHFF